MPGLFSRVKSWVRSENNKSVDVNAEFDNIIAKFEPQYMDDASANTTAFRAESATGAQGSESLPTSLQGEIQKLRYVLRRLLGTTYWYDSAGTDLTAIKNSLDAGLVFPANRVESGREDANGQPMYLIPNGSTGLRLSAATTPFRCYIKNVLITVNSNVDFAGLSGPSSFTALVNDATMADQQASKIQGEGTSVLTIDTNTGSAPSTGTFQAWKVNDGANNDYFMGRFDSTTQISRCMRGFLFDSSDAAIPRRAIANNDTITLCRAAYVFFTYVGSSPALTVTYNQPTISGTEPSGASSGDWWLDLSTNVWKKYNGSTWADGDGLWIGIAVMDGASLAGTRSADYGKGYSSLNTMLLEKIDAATIRTLQPGGSVSVYGNVFRFTRNLLTWEMASHLDSGVTEAASTTYYFYLTPEGVVKISDVAPHDRTGELQGYYHTHKPWRCLGYAANDSSSDLGEPSDYDVFGVPEESVGLNKLVNLASGLSDDSGTDSEAGTSYVDVTNLSVTLTTNGKSMIELCLLSSETGSTAADYSWLRVTGTDQAVAQADFAFVMDGTIQAVHSVEMVSQNASATTDPSSAVPVSSARHIITTPPAKGSHTFKFQMRGNPTDGGVAEVRSAKLFVRELPI